MFIAYIYYNLWCTQWEGQWQWKRAQTDTSGVVWATSKFFFFFSSFFWILTNIYSIYILWSTKERVAVMKTGLKDVSVIVWAISDYFSFFLLFFGILTNIYRLYNCNLWNTWQEGRQWQKQAISEFFFLFYCFRPLRMLADIYFVLILIVFITCNVL